METKHSQEKTSNFNKDSLIRPIKIEQDKIIYFMDFFFNFKPYPYQQEFVIECESNKRVAALWCRQSGKSTTTAVYSLTKALRNKNYNVLIIAPTQRQSSETYTKIRQEVVSNKQILDWTTKYSETEIKFKNGSRIVTLPCGPEGATIRGFTADLLILEESGYIKNSIVNEVLLPMIAATDGNIIKIGTPKGKNHFYDSCYGRESKYKLFHVGWERAVEEGKLNKELVEEERDVLTDLQFRTEYEAHFIEDEDCYFPQLLIDNCIEDIPQLDLSLTNRHPKSKYVLGVDFARLGQDVTTFIVLEQGFNQAFYKVCYIHEMKHKLLNEAGGYVAYLHKWFDFEKIYLDETGIGAGVTDYLSEQLGSWRIEPVTFTIHSKEDIFSNLKVLMSKGQLKIPQHRKLIYQLSDFRYELTGSGRFKLHHSEGGHDDYPDALALAAYHFKPIGGKPLFTIQ